MVGRNCDILKPSLNLNSSALSYCHTCVIFNFLVSSNGEMSIKVPITPKYFFRLNTSLHLFETNCTFLN